MNLQPVWNALGELLDPAVVINAAFIIMGVLVDTVGSVIPGPAGQSVQNLGTTMSGIRVDGPLRVIYFFIAPAVDVALFKAVTVGYIYVWVVTSVGRISVGLTKWLMDVAKTIGGAILKLAGVA